MDLLVQNLSEEDFARLCEDLADAVPDMDVSDDAMDTSMEIHVPVDQELSHNIDDVMSVVSPHNQVQQQHSEETVKDDNNQTPDNVSPGTRVLRTRKPVDYNLRNSSIINRIESEKRRSMPKKPKAKSKPPALSKYRRKTANSRERDRMQDMNNAFEALKNHIPNYQGGKLTKINTIRLALNYIDALRHTLGYEDCISSDGSLGAGSPGASSGSEGCLSPGRSNHSDTGSEGIISPSHSGLDSEGESLH